jgi:hypothetical protein
MPIHLGAVQTHGLQYGYAITSLSAQLAGSRGVVLSSPRANIKPIAYQIGILLLGNVRNMVAALSQSLSPRFSIPTFLHALFSNTNS